MRHRLLRRRSGHASGVDSHDARAFPRAVLSTRILRLGLAATAITLVSLAAWSSRDLETGERGLLRTGETGVVVIDLSLSIEGEDYSVVRRALRQLIAENANIGLVVFSDTAYELLPPGTPASQLRPLLRLLVPPRLGPPVNPWTQTFRAGTQISTAIELAQDMLERDHVVDGSVLLVSDLETAPDDVPDSRVRSRACGRTESDSRSFRSGRRPTRASSSVTPSSRACFRGSDFFREGGRRTRERDDGHLPGHAPDPERALLRRARRARALRRAARADPRHPTAGMSSTETRRRIALGAAALLCLGLAVVLVLVAVDVARWDEAFRSDDVSYRTNPTT